MAQCSKKVNREKINGGENLRCIFLQGDIKKIAVVQKFSKRSVQFAMLHSGLISEPDPTLLKKSDMSPFTLCLKT